MNADDERLAECDSEAARLLPWLVNERLDAADRERVQQHLAVCAHCRRDLEEQRRVQKLLQGDGSVEYAPQAGLAATLARIDELERQAPARAGVEAGGSTASSPARSRQLRWLAAAVIVQAIGLGLLATALVRRPSTAVSQASVVAPASAVSAPAYETLSSPAPAGTKPVIRAVFAGTMSVGDLRSLLAAERLDVLAGPGGAGVFSLGYSDGAVSAERVAQSLRVLRSRADVLFAESLVNEAARAP